jgi:uncharacterized protein
MNPGHPFKAIILSLLMVLSAFGVASAQNKGDDITIGKYDKIFSKILNEDRTLLISLPEGYEQAPGKFPVLYVLDGDKEVIAETYSMLAGLSWADVPRMVIVAIANTDRNRDMIPEKESEGASRFQKFLSEELCPYIEKNYKVDNYRILYGASNAGLFVVYSLLEKPETFSAYIASSPTILWANQLMIQKAKEFASGKSKLNKFLYVIYGDKEWTQVRDTLQAYIPLLESLTAKGLRLKTNYLPDEGHVPDRSLIKGLNVLFDGYSYPDQKRRKEGLDSLKLYYDRFSRQLGYNFNIPPRPLLGLGQRLLSQNKTNEALAVFQWYDKVYPGDGFCDIMFALTYYKDNKLDMAKKYYLKTKENKSLEIPPFPEWAEMKKKFD